MVAQKILRQPVPENSWPFRTICCGCPYEEEKNNFTDKKYPEFLFLTVKVCNATFLLCFCFCLSLSLSISLSLSPLSLSFFLCFSFCFNSFSVFLYIAYRLINQAPELILKNIHDKKFQYVNSSWNMEGSLGKLPNTMLTLCVDLDLDLIKFILYFFLFL